MRSAAFALTFVLLAVVAGLLWYGAGSEGDATEPVAAAPAPLPDALAETTGEEGTLRIEVVALERRSPGTLELRMAVTHIGSEPTALDIAQRFSADGPDRGTLSEIYLADLGHQQKLFILRDAEGDPIGSRDERPLAPGERRDVWAHFPAPSAGEDAVVVHVPHAEPMPNVPIAGESSVATPEETPEQAEPTPEES